MGQSRADFVEKLYRDRQSVLTKDSSTVGDSVTNKYKYILSADNFATLLRCASADNNFIRGQPSNKINQRDSCVCADHFSRKTVSHGLSSTKNKNIGRQLYRTDKVFLTRQIKKINSHSTVSPLTNRFARWDSNAGQKCNELPTSACRHAGFLFRRRFLFLTLFCAGGQ